ncbi:MAG: hypothetical protein C0503_02550 [Gemmatimonas sp.]|nr:hypothetical protein [Gemmatimonas sp.]
MCVYSTCTFCHAPLGANEALEHFPVGRKLAIDQARGRLWAVCVACGQWNLSPLEARWEAIEEGERLYRDTRLRTSTEHIGLARLRDGTELIRIGEPLRPEFAAWRYGERFAQRYRVSGRIGAAAGAAAWGMKFAGPVLNIVATAPTVGILTVGTVAQLLRRRLTAAWVELPEVGRVRLTYVHVSHLEVKRDPDADGGWSLRLPYEPPDVSPRIARFRDPFVSVRGPAAASLASQLMPRINRGGGRKADIADAVRTLEMHGSTDALMRLGTTFTKAVREQDIAELGIDPEDQPKLAEKEFVALHSGEFARTPAHVRLAIEMALHEETERRALQGELAELERRWQEAEEVAAIADGLVESPAVAKALERLRLR